MMLDRYGLAPATSVGASPYRTKIGLDREGSKIMSTCTHGPEGVWSLPESECGDVGHPSALDEAGYCPVCQHEHGPQGCALRAPGGCQHANHTCAVAGAPGTGHVITCTDCGVILEDTMRVLEPWEVI